MWPKYAISWSCTHRGLKCGDQMKVTWHQIMNIFFFSLCSSKKAVNIPDEVLDAATSAEVTTLNLSKNVLNKVPER